MRPTVPELTDLLGRGDIGETWSAVGDDGRPVAVKRVTCSEASGREHLLRRLDGLRDLAAAQPDLFVPVRATWVDGDDVWIVSDRDAGVSLRRLLRITTLTPAQLVHVAAAVLGGAAALHRVGLCHGAIHPGNVHIGVDGLVRLGDGGLAPVERRRVRGEEARLARADLAAVTATVREAVGGDRHSRRGYGLPATVLGVLDGLEAIDGPTGERALGALVESAGDLSGAADTDGARRQLRAMVGSITRTDGPPSGAHATCPENASRATLRTVPFAPPPPVSPCPLQARLRLLSIGAVATATAVVLLMLLVRLHR